MADTDRPAEGAASEGEPVPRPRSPAEDVEAKPGQGINQAGFVKADELGPGAEPPDSGAAPDAPEGDGAGAG